MLGPAKKETRKDRVCSITVTLARGFNKRGTAPAHSPNMQGTPPSHHTDIEKHSGASSRGLGGTAPASSCHLHLPPWRIDITPPLSFPMRRLAVAGWLSQKRLPRAFTRKSS